MSATFTKDKGHPAFEESDRENTDPELSGFCIQNMRGVNEVEAALINSDPAVSTYRDPFKTSAVMVVTIKNRGGTYIIEDCNENFLRTLGYNREEVVGKRISHFYSPDSLERAVFENGATCFAKDGDTIKVRKLVQKDGKARSALIKASPASNSNKNVIRIFAVCIDTSRQGRAEKTFQSTERQLKMILNTIPEPLMMVDKNMNLHMMNFAAENYFKKDSDFCLGQKCYQVLLLRRSPCPGCRVREVILTGNQKHYEREGFWGPEKLEQISIYPIREDDSALSKAVIRISDITRVRHIERELIQADKMISLGILVSGVAHEINNPNNFIMLNTPILLEAWKGVSPVIEKYYAENGDFSLAGLLYSEIREEIPLLFEGIKEGASRIQRIVDDLKNFARKDDTHLDQPVKINDIIKNAIRLTDNLIKESTTDFRVDYAEDLPMIKGNKQRLEQVMINLIENACQALTDNGKGIYIRSYFDARKYQIVIEVADEGEGIPQQLLNKIMYPFFTTKRGLAGTGIGLAVSSNIVNAHGGKIEVDSEPGKGSVFKVVIPTRIQKCKKILIVDDDLQFKNFLYRVFKDSGQYCIDVAANGKETFLKIGQNRPDILILDIVMPDMNGEEVCRLLKEKPELSGIKVIVVTGFSQSPMVERVIEMGYGNILEKPFTVKQLKKTIESILETDDETVAFSS